MSRLPWKTASLLLLGLLIALPLCGCTRRSALPPGDDPIDLSIRISPDPARVGPAEVQIRLEGPAGEAITGAQLGLRGDMTHAGMQPVLVEAEEAEPGVYVATMAWSMAGDWVLTVDGILADGTSFSRQFEFRVSDE